MINKLLIISLFYLQSYSAVGQQLYFDRLTSREGLSHNTVYCIAQDHKGFMWFGTRDGLSRFDSQRVRTYSLHVHHPAVESNRIHSLFADGQLLWIGTAMGLFRYDFALDSIVRVPLDREQIHVADIRRTSSGDIWLCGPDGIRILNQRGAIRHILPGQNIRTVREFRKGAYIVSQGGNLNLVNGEGDILLKLTVDDGNREQSSSFRDYPLYRDRHGTVWLGTNSGLFQLDERTMTFRAVEWMTQADVAHIRVIRTITEDKAGNLWVGSESGALAVNQKTRSVRPYDQSVFAMPNTLSDRSVYSSYVSRDGTLWLGTYFGGVNFARTDG